MLFADTHCHVQESAFDSDRGEVLARAADELEFIVVVGDKLETSAQAVSLAGGSAYAAVGVHPYHAESVDLACVAALRELAADPAVVAIGEMGLDYHYAETPRDVQHRALQMQLDLAIELGLPAIIHNRDSHEDMIAVMDAFHGRLAGGIMHCFAGSPDFARRCVDWGLYVSFAGNVTFPKAEELRRAAEVVPMDRLLLETDSPYLAPQAVRGRRCEPVYVVHTGRMMAELKGVTVDELARQTTANARRLFGVSGRIAG